MTDLSASALLQCDADNDPVVDALEEIRLRTWARKNYAPAGVRDETWHPIILDEMTQKDLDFNN